MRANEAGLNREAKGVDVTILTVKRFIAFGSDEPVFLHTAWGFYEVKYVDRDYWAHCPKANGGFGQSFAVHAGVRLYRASELEEVTA